MPTDFDTIYNQFDHAVSKMRMENRRMEDELAQRDGAIKALQRRLWDLESKFTVIQQENAALKAQQRAETTYVPSVTPRYVPSVTPRPPAPWEPTFVRTDRPQEALDPYRLLGGPPTDSPTQRTWSRPETHYPVETTPLMPETRREMGVDAPVFGPTLGERDYSHWMHDTGKGDKPTEG